MLLFALALQRCQAKKLTNFEISKKLRDLEDVYNNKLIKILLELRRENYNIKL